MEEYKDIINWLKVNKNSSFSKDEFNKGLELLRNFSTNKGVIITLTKLKFSPHSRGLLRHSLDIFIRRKIDLSNTEVKKRGNFTISSSIKGTPSIPSAPKKFVIHNTQKEISYQMVFMPDDLVALRAKSGELFRQAGKIHREMADRNFGKTDISEDVRKQNEQDALNLTKIFDENNIILNEIKHYRETGEILGKHPDLIEAPKKDEVVMTKELLIKAVKANTSYLSRARKEFSTELDPLKKHKKALRIKELEDKGNQLRDRLNALQ